MKTVWRMTAPTKAEKRFGKHPTQKPLSLIERCLLAASKEGDLILDPFMGAGTSAVACARLRRRFLGVELSASYANTAVQRLTAGNELEVQTELQVQPENSDEQ